MLKEVDRMEKMKWVLNKMPASEDKNLYVMALEQVKQARAFHRSFPQYSVTPLAKLDGMADRLGLAGLFVKDESYRFGLNAFKVLGGSFAMAKYIAGQGCIRNDLRLSDQQSVP